MLDESDLEIHLLEFDHRSFGYERSLTIESESYALFARTETESESKFRPRVIRLRVLVPREWLVLGDGGESLAVSANGRAPSPRSAGEGVEVAAEKSEFDEWGVAWRRVPEGKLGYLYVPTDRSKKLLSAEGQQALAGPGR